MIQRLEEREVVALRSEMGSKSWNLEVHFSGCNCDSGSCRHIHRIACRL